MILPFSLGCVWTVDHPQRIYTHHPSSDHPELLSIVQLLLLLFFYPQTLFNPNKTVVKIFVIIYDHSDMPPNTTTFIRQKTQSRPSYDIDGGIVVSQYNHRFLNTNDCNS